MGRWDTGIGSLTDSTRWRGKRGGAEETGGTGASRAVETGAARQRLLQPMRGKFKIKCLSAGSGGGRGERGRETDAVTRWKSKRKMGKKKTTKLTTNDLPSYPRTASLKGVRG